MRNNYKEDWQNGWNIDTFVKALKEIFQTNKNSRFINNHEFWTEWTSDVKFDLMVFRGKLEDLRVSRSKSSIGTTFT